MSKQKYNKKPSKQLEIARKRIDFLFEIASKEFDIDKKSSNKHIKIAQRIAMKNKLKFTPIQKKSFCKKCFSFLRVGVNCRVRLHKGRIISYCFECKNFKRHPIK